MYLVMKNKQACYDEEFPVECASSEGSWRQRRDGVLLLLKWRVEWAGNSPVTAWCGEEPMRQWGTFWINHVAFGTEDVLSREGT